MFLVDDAILFPARSLFWLFKEIHNAVQQELLCEKDTITTQLNELYMLLETQQINEEEFDRREKILLDRLDRFQNTGGVLSDEDSDEDIEEDEDDSDNNEEEEEGKPDA